MTDRVLWETILPLDAQIVSVSISHERAASLTGALEVLAHTAEWAREVYDCDTLELVATVQRGDPFPTGYTLHFAATRSK